MGKVIAKKIKWNDIKQKVRGLNIALFEAMDKISRTSKDNSYVYEISFPYGYDIIYKGQTNIFNEIVKSVFDENQNLDFSIFKQDFPSNQNHPLTLLMDGVIEVYKKNRYVYGTDSAISYTYPLEIFQKGRVFGTYETMDYLLDGMNNNYGYSVSSGHKSIYPILPNPTGGSSKAFKNQMEYWVERYNNASLNLHHKVTAMDIFPYIMEDIADKIDYQTKLLLIPKFWYSKENTFTDSMKAYISKLAWSQAHKSRTYNEELYNVHEIIKQAGIAKKSENIIMASQFVQYIESASKGILPVLKLNCDSGFAYLDEIDREVKKIINGTQNFAFFYFDFLEEGSKGILPLVTLPIRLINPDTKTRSASEFYKEIEDIFISIIEDQKLKKKISSNKLKLIENFNINTWEYMIENKYTKNSKSKKVVKYLSDKYQGYYPYASGVLTQIIVEIAR